MAYATIYIHRLASYEDTTMLKLLTHIEMLSFYVTTGITVPYISMLATLQHEKSFQVLQWKLKHNNIIHWILERAVRDF